MEFCRNVSISTDYHKQDQVLASPPPCALTATASPLDDLFPAQITDVDVGLEWLSVFVEDCLTSTGNCPPAAAPSAGIAGNMSTSATTPPKSPKSLQRNPQQLRPSFLQKYLIPVKPRSKRKRVTCMKTRSILTSWSFRNQNLHFPSSDPPLLQQTHWLADSELIVPRKEEGSSINSKKEEVGLEDLQEQQLAVRSKKHRLGNEEYGSNGGQQQQPRRCTHCLSQRTPQWRAGPMGPKTLCNACGVRYKSGRLLPEYRPAKSPTFVSFLHSNSHKKVLEMRMAMATSSTPV